MRVLFLIPKATPPVLEGNFSPAFKEFVALCLTKNMNTVRTRALAWTLLRAAPEMPG